MQCDNDDTMRSGGNVDAMREQATTTRKLGAKQRETAECSSDDAVPEELLLMGPLLVDGEDVLLRSPI
jgi:hypothetical protein